MRIVHAVHGWPLSEMGGVGRYVEALVWAQRAAGDRASVLAPRRRPGVEDRVTDGVHGTLVGGVPPLSWRQTARPLLLDWALRRWLRRTRPDVLHVHHLSGLSVSLPRLAKEAGAAVVFTLHDYHLVCARGQLVDADGALCAGPQPGRCPACARGDGAPIAARPLPEPRASMGLEALRAADLVLSPSRDLSERMRRLGAPPISRCPLPLVHPVAPAPAPEPGPVRFLFLGSILPTKGPDRALRAFGRLPSGVASLTLAGPGEGEFRAKLRAEALATPGVSWQGAVAPGDVSPLLARHDVLVLPSTWPENSPLVVREATAAGLRVVLGALGGARELAPDARIVAHDAGDDELARILLEEVALGRGRRPPVAWPTPAEHAAWLRDRLAARDASGRSE